MESFDTNNDSNLSWDEIWAAWTAEDDDHGEHHDEENVTEDDHDDHEDLDDREAATRACGASYRREPRGGVVMSGLRAHRAGPFRHPAFSELIISTSGRNIAMMIVPMMPPSTMTMMGCSSETSAATATSTSSS